MRFVQGAPTMVALTLTLIMQDIHDNPRKPPDGFSFTCCPGASAVAELLLALQDTACTFAPSKDKRPSYLQ
jgi:hypothetical protein